MLDLIIIGAGISGLRAAARAQALGLDYRVLEARDRIGGRAFGEAGLDLGPSWVWPVFQPRINTLIEALGLRAFAQQETGALRYETAEGVQTIDFPKRYADAVRIDGGPGALARHMAETLDARRISLNAEIVGADFKEGAQVRLADGRTLAARQVIIAVPPRLVLTWSITPGISDRLRSALSRWPTWMAAHAKISLRYGAPFWREAGLSGSAISQAGPLMEVVDHSDDAAGRFALFGFYGWPAGVRRRKAESLQAETIAQLERLFGPQAAVPDAIALKDWAQDRFTAVPEDSPGPREHPPYAEPALREAWFDGRLVFAGAEAAAEHGGLIEGALLAADVAVNRIAQARA
jgi:monoamine oxidase